MLDLVMILLGKAAAKTWKRAYTVTGERQEESIFIKFKVIVYLVGESFQTASISLAL